MLLSSALFWTLIIHSEVVESVSKVMAAIRLLSHDIIIIIIIIIIYLLTHSFLSSILH